VTFGLALDVFTESSGSRMNRRGDETLELAADRFMARILA
jgi:hypothetical protein